MLQFACVLCRFPCLFVYPVPLAKKITVGWCMTSSFCVSRHGVCARAPRAATYFPKGWAFFEHPRSSPCARYLVALAAGKRAEQCTCIFPRHGRYKSLVRCCCFPRVRCHAGRLAAPIHPSVLNLRSCSVGAPFVRLGRVDLGSRRPPI